MSVFPLKFRTALRTIIYASSDASGRPRLLEICLEGCDETRQSTISDNTPELFLCDKETGTDPSFDLVARTPTFPPGPLRDCEPRWDSHGSIHRRCVARPPSPRGNCEGRRHWPGGDPNR